MKNLQFKKGVSLIAVLLFMLVATIAATATFKWLTSSGTSSGSRMMQKEAYQSAIAGLENARTWMTFHANDVGALIKQYKDPSNANAPIKINSQLRDLARANQDFDVWLVGVNTEETTYKLKIVSTGKARNGSVHSEVGIFNVDGLYQVEIPRERVTATVDFEEAFFGNLATAGDIYVNSAIITQTPDVKNAGGQALNYMGITDYLILDGNFYVNASATMKDVYITGHFGFCADFTATGNLYVGGDLYPGAGASTATINGSAYVNGSVKLNSTYKLTSSTGGCSSTTTGSIAIGTNATINGPIEYYDRNGGSSFTVNGNLVLNSYIDFPDNYPTSLEYISVGHNAYIKEKSNYTGKIGTSVSEVGDYSVTFYHYSGYDYVHKTQFGSNINDQFYMNGVLYTYGNGSTQYPYYKCGSCAKHYCNNSYGLNCAVLEDNDIWVGFRGNYLTTPPSAATLEAWGADPMESYAEKVNTRDPNCSNEIKNPIQFNRDVLESSLIHSSSNLMGCDAGIFNTEWAANDWVTKVDTCYTIAQSRKELYNDEFLIIQTPDKMNMNGGISTAFTHKIIWINPASKYHMYSLPPTAEGGQVFLYLPYGNSTNQGGIVTGTAGNYDYFIFSDGDIADFQMQTQIRGSLVMGNCSKLNTNTNNASLNISTDGTSIIDDMASAAIICNNDGTNKCSSGSGTGTSTETTSSTITYSDTDAFYVANAPQLSVSLETQYKANNDEVSSATTASTNIEAGFIVLPRIIYMTTDPYGELSDYYSVIPLNGLNYNKENGSVSCEGGIRSSGELYARGSSNPTPLSEGIHNCHYEYNGMRVPFYIKVEGTNGNAPVVQFEKSFAEMGATDALEVKVIIPPHASAITLNFIRPADMTSWSFNKAEGVNCSDNNCTLTIPAKNEGSETKTLFTVTTSGAGNGTATFQLKSGEGYAVGSPNTSVLSVSSSIYVARTKVSDADLDAFCENHTSLCPSESNRESWPDCQVSNWVYATGYNCTVNPTKPDDEWSCGIGQDVSLQVSEDVPNWCVAIVPSYTLTNVEAGKTYELPANIKAKPMKFQFGFSGSDVSGKPINAGVATRSANVSCEYGSTNTTSADYCEMEVFKGETIELTFPNGRPDNFNYWKCVGENCTIKTPQSGDTYSIDISEDNLKVLAYFDQNDKHCFFDEFKLDNASCGENAPKYCIGTNGSKWQVADNDDLNKIDYQHGYIAAKSSRSDKSGVMVMSQAQAGVKGTLKAQFQVPRVTSSERIPEAVSNSGFILRSNTISGSDKYLFLNLYTDIDGLLVARLCNESGSTCGTTSFSGSRVDAGNTVVTLTAEMSETAVNMTVLLGSMGSANSYSAIINLEGVFDDGYRKEYEYMGFRLADPNFKLFDYGWRSETYGSECWDTYPTVDCSFKAAYAGGIVPKDQEVKPWVGLSSWFSANGCSPKYYYNGNDAGCSGGDPYGVCSNGYYKFTSNGIHGSDQTIAMAGVAGEECFSALTPENKVLAESEMGHCGIFWVGTTNHCTEHTTFFRESSSRTVYANSSENFNLAAGVSAANVRETELRVEVENADGAEMEIFLLSQASSMADVYYSKTYITSDNGIIVIDVSNLFDADGFNPEQVIGVSIRNNSTTKNIAIKSIETTCPYVVTLTCNGDLKYEAQKWKFTTNVTNYEGVASISITQEGKSSPSFKCSADGTVHEACPLRSGATIKQATYGFEIDEENNPFLTPGTYKFTVLLEPVSGVSVEPCSEEITVAPAKCLSAKVEGSEFIATLDKDAWAGTLYLNDGTSTTPVNVTGSSSEFRYDIPESMRTCETGTCTYKITLDPLGDDNSCEKEWTVAAKPVITLDCREDPITVALGEDVSFTSVATGCESECTLSVSSGSISPTSSFNGGTITITDNNATVSTGNTYTITMSRENAKNDATCTITVNYTAPITVECGPIEDQTGVDMGAEVSVTPHGVTGCNSNCSYTIKNGSTIVGGGSSVTNYDGGAMTMTDASNTSTGPITYSAVISKGGYSAEACTFRVAYNEPEAPARTCDTIPWTISETNSTLEYTSISKECVVVKTSRYCSGQIQITARGCPNKSATWNGKPFTFNSNNDAYKDFSPNPAPSLISILELPDACGSDVKIYMSDCIDLNYASSAPVITCPTSTKTVAPGGSVSIPVSNCRVIGGCNYMITATGTTPKQGNGIIANSISFTGESATNTYNYTMNVSNSEGDATPCNFSVQYDANSAEPVGPGKYFGPKKIKVSHTGTCQVNTSSNCSTWPNWVSKPPSCYGSNGQVSGGPTIDIPSGQWLEIQNCW